MGEAAVERAAAAHVVQSARPTMSRTWSSSAGQASHVTAVSNVPVTSPSPAVRPSSMLMKALRHAPTAPLRPVGLPEPSSIIISSSGTSPPDARATSTAVLMFQSWGSSEDSNPIISKRA